MYAPYTRMKRPVVIVVQQLSLKERPRIHKLAKVLAAMSVPFEIWKYGDGARESFDNIEIRNLMSASWFGRRPVLRYLMWMIVVYLAVLPKRRSHRFFAVGFDSALPIALQPVRSPRLTFDNIDNVSMSYRWPGPLLNVFQGLERWVARRAQIHVNPSRVRWKTKDRNLRVVTNTPSAEMLEEAKALAAQRRYTRSDTLTIYLNGWLSPTRGIGTLVRALNELSKCSVPVKVLVAGRPACPEAETLLAMPNVENLGMVTNAEALASYYRSDLAFIYYDPALEINRLAESQKWTDCWATETAFVSNEEIFTLKPYVECGACFTTAYHDVDRLVELLKLLINERRRIQTIRDNLAQMQFRYWDEEMAAVMHEWFKLDDEGRRQSASGHV